ncbi:MAG TPA: bifunctional 5,10-methylenetetrahydrofolate dehydrogenase/5,10-methenyltetrahydrofolate cyclohydrolase [Chloroflexota bacterium]|nr:bifunctional 5,10-methylenetetrahydrofolate dehydrogenase/5,10-methenyltetrahydrofolate cyclohydrolase [Chloroflexota bacterium]
MTAIALSGKSLADQLIADAHSRAQAFQAQAQRPATLAIVQIGEDQDAAVYSRSLLRACRRVGLQGDEVRLPVGTDERTAVGEIRRLGGAAHVDAIMIQTPLPGTMRRAALTDAIPPVKDVDGLSGENTGLLAQGRPRHVPATARALLLLAEASGITISGTRAVVVGRSDVVGLPTALMLLQANATLTVCHRATADLAEETRRAQLLVVAVGRPGLITGNMVAPGAVVLDAGTTMTPEGLRGDVDAASVMERAAALTPVPGGVGPVTTAVLLQQVVAAAEERAGWRE